MCHCHSRPTCQLDNQQKRGSSVRFLPSFCRQGCLCNPTAASCRCLPPATRPCAYCAESQRPTRDECECEHQASGSPRRVNRARARMALGSPRQRHSRATSQPAGAVARGARHQPDSSTTVTLSAHSFCTTQVCSQVHTSTYSLLTPGQWDQAAASIVMHRPRAPLINLPPFPLHAQITTAARTTEPHGRGIV